MSYVEKKNNPPSENSVNTKKNWKIRNFKKYFIFAVNCMN